jgi:hypothetical protein
MGDAAADFQTQVCIPYLVIVSIACTLSFTLLGFVLDFRLLESQYLPRLDAQVNGLIVVSRCEGMSSCSDLRREFFTFLSVECVHLGEQK